MDRNQSVGRLAVPPATSTTCRIDESRQGGSAFYGKGIGLFDSVSMLYAFEDIKANFPVRSAPGAAGPAVPAAEVHRDDGHDLLADARATATTAATTRSTRPAGSACSASVQYAPTFLGGERPPSSSRSVGSTHLHPGPRSRGGAIIGLNLEVGYVTGLSGDEIPIFERFQLGGEQSLRGFRAGAVVPARRGHQPGLHGLVRPDPRGQQVLRPERRVPVPVRSGRRSSWPSSTSGNNYHESQPFDIARVRASAGAELRIFLPIFQAPLRFIYSFNLHPDPARSTSSGSRSTSSRRSRPGSRSRSGGRSEARGPGQTGPIRPGMAPKTGPVVQAGLFATLPRFREEGVGMKRFVLTVAAALVAASAWAQGTTAPPLRRPRRVSGSASSTSSAWSRSRRSARRRSPGSRG